ncbi:unnamed protein product [Vitrella brassicaformis CCMP3155]|uniref:Uncharacterized protein n=2 Tax=Vitrella brassicaformis TaxID=1169539 RepID=A0A0G4ELP9_VITBC|nr:unnamed protein product [Vitrella brassicaformis CCMP3155]|eukprot:CEL97758.1 unnamed protein product [Vitrella brassicaformis CCMP3155]
MSSPSTSANTAYDWATNTNLRLVGGGLFILSWCLLYLLVWKSLPARHFRIPRRKTRGRHSHHPHSHHPKPSPSSPPAQQRHHHNTGYVHHTLGGDACGGVGIGGSLGNISISRQVIPECDAEEAAAEAEAEGLYVDDPERLGVIPPSVSGPSQSTRAPPHGSSSDSNNANGSTYTSFFRSPGESPPPVSLELLMAPYRHTATGSMQVSDGIDPPAAGAGGMSDPPSPAEQSDTPGVPQTLSSAAEPPDDGKSDRTPRPSLPHSFDSAVDIHVSLLELSREAALRRGMDFDPTDSNDGLLGLERGLQMARRMSLGEEGEEGDSHVVEEAGGVAVAVCTHSSSWNANVGLSAAEPRAQSIIDCSAGREAHTRPPGESLV